MLSAGVQARGGPREPPQRAPNNSTTIMINIIIASSIDYTPITYIYIYIYTYIRIYIYIYTYMHQSRSISAESAAIDTK